MKLLSASFVKQIRASFTQYKTVASAATLNRILVEAEEGNFIYFAKYFDTFYVKDGAGASDGAVLDFFKTLTDDAALADNATNQFMKALQNVGVFTDEQFVDFFKNINDPVGAAEAHAFDVWKPRADAFSIGDDGAKLHPNKITFDGLSTQDDSTISFGKPLTDGSDVSEFYEASFWKPRSDAFGVTDTDSWLLEKPFEDEVISPDDYVVLFTKKAPDDPLTLTETVEKSLSRGFSDAYSIGEAHSLEPGKVLFDQVTGIGDYVFLFTKKAPDNPVGTTDEINTLGVGKNLADTGSLSDQINTIAFAKPLTEAPAAIDEINTKATTKALASSVGVTDDVDGAASILDDQEMQFVKNTTDTASFSDHFIIYKNYYRDFVDSAATDDAIAMAYLKQLSDNAFASDVIDFATGKALYDIANTGDNEYFNLSKPVQNSATVSELCVYALTKARSDLASTTDAGSLRSQGYSDFTYFAEDFVGASRTF